MADPAYMLDSNIIIYALQGASATLGERLSVQPEGTLALSSISLAEIAIGYEGGSLDLLDLEIFQDVIAIAPFDEKAAIIYGTLPFRRQSFDRLIAAHALSLDLTLVTNNEADFADIPGLRIENWTV